MKPNWNEEKFKQLFLQSKQADEQIAPSFANVWGAASRNANQAGHSRFSFSRFGLRLAVALITIIALGASAFFYLRHQVRQSTQPEMAGLSEPPSNPVSPDFVAAMPAFTKSPFTKSRRTDRRASAPRLRQFVPAISEWRSPTGSLLMIPGDEILKSVPRLGESVVELKTLAP
jgi:hypothetical protein